MNMTNRYAKFTAAAVSLLCLGIASPASAQSLKEKVVGAWTLDVGAEIFQDGKKAVPWATGNLMLDPTGHMSFFVIGKDRAKGTDDVRSPAGPMVAYYGTYTVDEAEGTITYKIEHAGNPLFEGAVRKQKVAFKGDVMSTTGTDIKTPQGMMTPVNEWKKAK
jgi:Lipocalin-like domain